MRVTAERLEVSYDAAKVMKLHARHADPIEAEQAMHEHDGQRRTALDRTGNRRDAGEVRGLDPHPPPQKALPACNEAETDEKQQREQRDETGAHACEYRRRSMLRVIFLLTLVGCGPRSIPPGLPDQS